MPRHDEVFIIQGSDIQPLRARPFKAGLFGKTLEDALQTLIERQPNIINGRQIDPGAADPPRFVLLCREMQVGDWSLDHLLVDQHGVLTFVEAKLLENPEARRAVIGQILDYAAYASENWSNGRLRQLANAYWQRHNGDVDAVLRDALGNIDVDSFWNQVESNLAQSKIRLIIVADELQPEVRRVVEFLNQQLRTIQLFGLEVRCFGEDPNAVVVPFLIGQTQATTAQKGIGSTRNWTVDELRTAYSNITNARQRDQMLGLLDWAVKLDCITIPGDTKGPVFGLASQKGQQIVSISPTSVYVILRTERYKDIAERDRLVADLKGLGLYPADFDAAAITDGKNLTGRPGEFEDRQFADLLAVLSRYCKART